MKRFFAFNVILIISVFLLFCLSAPAAEQKFPTRDIDIYVGFPPGGTDIAQAVILAETMKNMSM